MKNLKYLLTIVPVFLMTQSPAQEENCAFRLREAQQLYEAGRIEDIPGMLQPCIERGFTQEERLTAFKLIILCQIYNDNRTQNLVFDFSSYSDEKLSELISSI